MQFLRLTLLTSLFLFFAISSFAQVMHGKVDRSKVLNFNGAYLVFAKPEVAIHFAGKMLHDDPVPIKLNGEKIYDSYRYQALKVLPKIKGYKNLSAYIKKQMNPFFSKLPDGRYRIATYSLVVNKEGKLVYYDYSTLRDYSNSMRIGGAVSSLKKLEQQLNELEKERKKKGVEERLIDPKLKHEIETAMFTALKNAPEFSPAKNVKGQKVNCYLNGPNDNFNSYIVVENGKVTYENSALRKL